MTRLTPRAAKRSGKPSRPPRREKPAAAARPAPPKKAAPVETKPPPEFQKVQNLAVSEDEDGMRLDRWFRRRLPSLSLSHLNKIVRKGEVRVDGKRAETSTRLTTGALVRVPPLSLEPAKPAIVRAEPNEADVHAIRDMVLVHRLDRDTSGVLLIAKSRKMAADLGEIFRSRQARKIYWAVVEGVPKPPQGRISLFLAKGTGMGDERGPRQPGPRRDPEKMRVAKHGEEDAQHSITFYATVDKVAPRLAWLSMKPITGRTHQLRAHAEAIGHPIIGDPKYGVDDSNSPRRTDPLRAIPAQVERKLHLLARRLVLPHPKGGTIDVTAPLPPHMQKTFELFGFDAKQYDPIEDAPEE